MPHCLLFHVKRIQCEGEKDLEIVNLFNSIVGFGPTSIYVNLDDLS